MCDQKLIDFLQSNRKYQGFKFLSEPTSFKKLFAKTDIPVVNIYDCGLIEKDQPLFGNAIIGFVGGFSWLGGNRISLDGDSYDDPLVLGYKWYYRRNVRCLSILVVDSMW